MSGKKVWESVTVECDDHFCGKHEMLIAQFCGDLLHKSSQNYLEILVNHPDIL
jgi:hypothetical protein